MDQTPPHIKEAAQKAMQKLLPDKSSKRYNREYNLYKNWCAENKTTNSNENVLLAYFNSKTDNFKPSTLWSIYSMLKSTISLNENVDISKYNNLIAFLKRQSDGYRPKKSKILETHQINQFLKDAPDNKYLLLKAALIVGISGACRRDELVKMSVNDIQEKDNIMVVNIPDTKTKTTRTFVIQDTQWLDILKTYIHLRPIITSHNRFFIFYTNGRCTAQPVGINTFGNMPSKIAEFLKLDNAKEYTGHCFRRSSATMLASHGADLLTVKRHGGWKSSNVAEGYIEDSLATKVATANKLLGTSSFINDENSSTSSFINDESPSTSSSISIEPRNYSINVGSTNEQTSNSHGFTFNNCQNCTFNFHIHNNK